MSIPQHPAAAAQPRAGDMPRICFMSYDQLRAFSLPVVAEYTHRAQIEMLAATFERALALARERVDKGLVDVFVSAGSNAGVLRAGLQAPVVSIEVSGYDLMQALIRAKAMSPRVGVITYGDAIPPLDELKSLLVLDLTQYRYKTPDEAHRCVQQLKRQGVQVVLGSSLIVDMAEKAGLKGVLTYSLASVRAAFEQALEVARIGHLEATRFEQLNSVLHTLPEAVVAVDAQEQIIAINQAMHALLSPAGVDLRGRVLSQVQPALSLADTVRSGERSQPVALRLAEHDWVSNRSPIFDNGRVVGAAMTLYDARTIHTADTKLRMLERTRQFTARHHFGAIAGHSQAITDTIARAKRFAKTELDVLILGESGTGKELFAQAIHNDSARAAQPFIAVNCAAFPESLIEGELFGHDDGAFTGARRGGRRGLIEAAHTGTLFLDEIGDMPLSLQTRLLRVLQEREITRLGSNAPIPVDIRIIAATHQPLTALVAQQRFRQDLYFRLNTLRLALPPLRERQGDVQELLALFLSAYLPDARHESIEQVRRQLERPMAAYAWPGNARELDSMAKRLAVLLRQQPGAVSTADLLHELPELTDGAWTERDATPATENRAQPLAMAPAMSRRQRVNEALAAAQGRHAEAALQLGISRTTLWRWLKA